MREPSIASVQYTKGVVPDDQKRWRQFLETELTRIQAAIQLLALGHLDVTYVEPDKPRQGDFRYADGTAWNPGFGEGIYLYSSTGWEKI